MKFNKTTLHNGLNIITVPMTDNPAVTVLVMVSTGSKYESKKTNGLSHFLEHMVFKGTPKRPKAIDIAKELESLGAQYNAFTAQEYTGYYAKVNPENIDTALDVVSDIYLHPLLDQKEIEKEKGVIIEEIRMYQEHYVAGATTVIVSGSFDEKNIIGKIEKAFDGISTEKKFDKIKVNEVQSKPEISVKFKETDQAHLVLGVRSFDAKSKYDSTLSVLSTILGRGMSSRLFQKLREEMGVGYYIHASQDSYTDHGLFAISAGVDTKRTEEVIKVLLAECKKIIDEPITDEEMKKVKDYICGSFMLGLETSDARAEYVAIDTILKGTIISPKEEIEKIQKVTVEEVKDLAKKIFVDEGLNLAIIGPYKDKGPFEKILTFEN